ncbi:hypothetical protein CLV43_11930 [Umezawaea tangerina]|uniref:Uncharacterized protein n=1 Tax=Umezawaea tangerina TaxID=84725 RepID=A0A2T0SK13_9PSEU|nr:hypothetical protein CLV43_11930 [Umezawaea tangerina]
MCGRNRVCGVGHTGLSTAVFRPVRDRICGPDDRIERSDGTGETSVFGPGYGISVTERCVSRSRPGGFMIGCGHSLTLVSLTRKANRRTGPPVQGVHKGLVPCLCAPSGAAVGVLPGSPRTAAGRPGRAVETLSGSRAGPVPGSPTIGPTGVRATCECGFPLACSRFAAPVPRILRGAVEPGRSSGGDWVPMRGRGLLGGHRRSAAHWIGGQCKPSGPPFRPIPPGGPTKGVGWPSANPSSRIRFLWYPVSGVRWRRCGCPLHDEPDRGEWAAALPVMVESSLRPRRRASSACRCRKVLTIRPQSYPAVCYSRVAVAS